MRIATLPDDDVPARLIGGSLKTLLYMAQLASISMDPFFSTLDALHTPDQVAIDLDPQPGATFDQILDVARWVHEVLEKVGVPGFPKTSGSEGLHIFIPLAPGTPYHAGMLFCQIVATMVVGRASQGGHGGAHREQAQGRHGLRGLPAEHRGQDAGLRLQRPRPAPSPACRRRSTWAEVHAGVRPEDFTLDTIIPRVRAVGDLWAGLRGHDGADLLGGAREDPLARQARSAT